MLSKQPILAYPNFKQRFYLSTETPKVDFRTVLFQLDEADRQKPRKIYYARRSLNRAKRSYSAIERELLATVDSEKKLRYYSLSKELTISTDQITLTTNFLITSTI